jgi:hypothetical protein
VAPPRKQAENRENKRLPTALVGSCLLERFYEDRCYQHRDKDVHYGSPKYYVEEEHQAVASNEKR